MLVSAGRIDPMGKDTTGSEILAPLPVVEGCQTVVPIDFVLVMLRSDLEEEHPVCYHRSCNGHDGEYI